MKHVATDESGVLVGFPHHDGTLDGVLLIDGGTVVELLLTDTAGRKSRLQLRGVRALQVEDLREGNIVLRIELWAVRRARERRDLAEAIDERLGLRLERLSPESLVFQLTPSYGARILAVCEGVEAQNASPTYR